jgi:hypothetical protein
MEKENALSEAVRICMEMGSILERERFESARSMLWSLLNPADGSQILTPGWGSLERGTIRKIKMLVCCRYVCITNIQSNFGEYTYASPPV